MRKFNTEFDSDELFADEIVIESTFCLIRYYKNEMEKAKEQIKLIDDNMAVFSNLAQELTAERNKKEVHLKYLHKTLSALKDEVLLTGGIAS